jgi:tetratricopeptide (TPR) repeat protein
MAENMKSAEECVALARTLQHHSALTVLALNTLGHNLVPTGDGERAVAICREAVDLATALGNRSLIGLTNGPLGQALVTIGDLDGARTAWQESIDQFSQINEELTLPSPLCWLAHLELITGNPEAAERAAMRAVGILQRTGDVDRLSEALSHLARVRMAQDDFADARGFLLEALSSTARPTHEKSAEVPSPAWALTATAEYLAAENTIENAIVLIEAARSAAGELTQRVMERPEIDAILETGRASLVADDYEAALDQGKTMSAADAIALAMEFLR